MGEINLAVWRKMTCKNWLCPNLEHIVLLMVYQDSDARYKSKKIPIKNSSQTEKLWKQILFEEIKPVVMEKKQYECRVKAKLETL